MIRILLAAGTVMALCGCSALLATSEEFYYHEEVYAPRKAPSDVTLYEQARPRTPFVVLGRIVATQGLFGSRDSVLDELRRKAADMGADAVVDLDSANDPSQQGEDRGPGTTHFSKSGNISTSESWQPGTGSSIRMTVTGLAVRFIDPK